MQLLSLEGKTPELAEHIRFDPEGGMFCVYSSNREALVSFSLAFKAACEDHNLISDLLTRTELDLIFSERLICIMNRLRPYI